MPDVVTECLQDVVDRINGEAGSTYFGHALIVTQEEHLKTLQSMTSAPAIAVMYGGIFGADERGNREGFHQLLTVEVFIVTDITELCDGATADAASVDALRTVYDVRQLVHEQKSVCKQWRLVSELITQVEGVSGFMQRWDTKVSLYQTTP